MWEGVLYGSKNALAVTPWLDHIIQLKILKLLVCFIVFMDPVVKPRGDTMGFTGPRNNAFPRRRESSTLKLLKSFI
jgi:hypothetical protein